MMRRRSRGRSRRTWSAASLIRTDHGYAAFTSSIRDNKGFIRIPSCSDADVGSLSRPSAVTLLAWPTADGGAHVLGKRLAWPRSMPSRWPGTRSSSMVGVLRPWAQCRLTSVADVSYCYQATWFGEGRSHHGRAQAGHVGRAGAPARPRGGGPRRALQRVVVAWGGGFRRT